MWPKKALLPMYTVRSTNNILRICRYWLIPTQGGWASADVFKIPWAAEQRKEARCCVVLNCPCFQQHQLTATSVALMILLTTGNVHMTSQFSGISKLFLHSRAGQNQCHFLASLNFSGWVNPSVNVGLQSIVEDNRSFIPDKSVREPQIVHFISWQS